MPKKKPMVLVELQPGDLVFASARDSGGKRQALSVGQQKAEIERYATERGLIIARWFVDEATPAADVDKRDDFQLMVDECLRRPPPVRGVLVWNLARWSRGQDEVSDDALLYKIMLRRNGVNVVSVSDNIPDGYLGPVVEKIVEASNYLENRRKAQDVKRALQSLAAQGFPPGGRPPLGLLSVPTKIPGGQGRELRMHHRWIPDPAMAPAIRRAFEMRADGCTVKQIHEALHLYPTKHGYDEMLCNPVYKGTLRCGGQEYPGRVEAIVGADLWQSAQIRGLRRGRASGTYLLSGLLRCGICGSAMTGKHNHKVDAGRVYDYWYYQCAGWDRSWGETCNARLVPMGELDALVLAELRTQMLDADTVIRALAGLRQLTAEQDAPDGERLEGRAEQLRRLITRQQQLASDPDFDYETARQRVRELRAELAQIEAQIARARGGQLARYDAEYVRNWVHYMTTVLDGDDMVERKRLLRRLIAEIRVNWPDVTASFRPLDEALRDE